MLKKAVFLQAFLVGGLLTVGVAAQGNLAGNWVLQNQAGGGSGGDPGRTQPPAPSMSIQVVGAEIRVTYERPAGDPEVVQFSYIPDGQPRQTASLFGGRTRTVRASWSGDELMVVTDLPQGTMREIWRLLDANTLSVAFSVQPSSRRFAGSGRRPGRTLIFQRP